MCRDFQKSLRLYHVHWQASLPCPRCSACRFFLKFQLSPSRQQVLFPSASAYVQDLCSLQQAPRLILTDSSFFFVGWKIVLFSVFLYPPTYRVWVNSDIFGYFSSGFLTFKDEFYRL